MAKLNINSILLHNAIATRQAFETHTSSMTGVEHGVLPYNHQLPQEWEARYRRDRERIRYVVLSYDTPIAWVLGSGTVVVPREMEGWAKGQPLKYSRTTSKHQRIACAALGVPFVEGREPRMDDWGLREARERPARMVDEAAEMARTVQAQIESVPGLIGPIAYEGRHYSDSADGTTMQGFTGPWVAAPPRQVDLKKPPRRGPVHGDGVLYSDEYLATKGLDLRNHWGCSEWLHRENQREGFDPTDFHSSRGYIPAG
jgi:hypothetical protein